MNWNPDDWERLGTYIRAERESRGLSRRELALVSGISEKSIQLAEEGRVPKRRWPQSLNALEAALGWDRGGLKAILSGGEPPVRTTAMSDSQMVVVPSALYADLIAIAAHVSAGRSAAFVQQRPYPDALARRTLGALDDAGLLPDRHSEDVASAVAPTDEER